MNKRNLIIAGVVVVLLIAAYFGIRALNQGNQAAAAAGAIQTETISTGPLVATIGATGTVRANQSANLTWQTSGTVGGINVAVGDTVAEGDLLAELGQTSLPQNVILAQADLVSAQQALEDLYESYQPLAVAQAAQALAAADTAADDAQRFYGNVTSPARQTDIDQAQADVVLARDRLDKAQDRFDPYANKPDSVTKANLQSQLAQAQAAYDNASRLYNSLIGVSSDLDVAQAEADLQLALANLADAQEHYDDLQAGPKGSDIAAAEARIAAAQATLDLAMLDAPFNGTVTRVDAKLGDLVANGTSAFRVDDLSHLLVDVDVSEVDINRVQVGQSVVLSFDAILAREYTGRVTEVSLVGDVVQGIVNFTVTVELLDADELVKPGMTAAVNIVVSELENVLLVPNRAVRVLEGERVVFIQRNGTFESVTVELGATSELYSEVTGGELEAGMSIVLNPPFDLFANFGPPQGGGFGDN
jgi:HlyD family secretion protein